MVNAVTKALILGLVAMKKLIFLSSILIIAYACKKPEEPPVFKGVANVKVSRVEGTTAYINADAFFHNPNDIKLKIRKVDIEVYLDGQSIGVINESDKTKVPAKSDFTVPLYVAFNLKDTGVLKNLLSFIGGNKREVSYVGYISVSAYGLPVKVKVDHTEEVRVRL